MSGRITSPFGAKSTAREVVAGHDLSGRVAIVTGAATGIGVETVRARLADFIALTGVDEVMVTGMIHDLDARLHSLEVTAEAIAGL